MTETTRLQELLPQPAEVQPHPEVTFTLDPSAAIVLTTEDARHPAERLAEILRPSTGYPLEITTTPAETGIIFEQSETPAEAYELEVTATTVTIRSATPAGHFNAVATLRQLLPPQAEAKTEQPGPWTVPGAKIQDHPRYPHRGAMLDVTRHFFTTDQVKRYIDQVAAYKINYFHLHLSDDQGWRLEIKSWPNLTKIGGRTEVGGRTGNFFYTQAEYADLVTYAQNRGITVIPEFDMPGHTNAAQASYPELNDDDQARDPYTGIEVGFSSLAIDKDITYAFIDDVVREVAAITPGPYLHIGGDEALTTPDADYQAFMTRALPIVQKHGKTAIGWHEFVKTTEDTTPVVQFWNQTTADENVAAAAKRGNKVIMSPANRIYLDMKYTEETELGLKWAGHVEVEASYDWNPGAYLDGVTEEDVLGVEAPLWTETVASSADIEYLAFPRLTAAAELGWSPQSTHDWPGFARRLGAQAKRWEVQGINYYRSPQVPWQD
ncbi:beta-N-acetylhexosaminidase [Lentzea sp. NPDC059081]|uniref:beta-N-acetylhexosaminidase n=1 Tax=Lentzea sp. NPDC059081 TaxID=3346719 RepID=UPI003689247A